MFSSIQYSIFTTGIQHNYDPDDGVSRGELTEMTAPDLNIQMDHGKDFKRKFKILVRTCAHFQYMEFYKNVGCLIIMRDMVVW